MSFHSKRHAVAAGAILFLSVAAQADDNFVYGSVGEREPIELGFGHAFSDDLAIRLGLGRGETRSYDHTVAGSDYRVKPNDSTVLNAMVDWYFLPSHGVRLTGGLAYASNAGLAMSGKADANGGYLINGNTYSSGAVGTYATQVNYRKLSPYLGIGWDYARPDKSGWRFISELGVRGLMRNTTTASATGAAGNPALSQDLAAQRQRVNGDFGGTRWQLTAGMGVSYSF